nr:hypothetical protein [Butyrivibrio sp. WCD3002]
MRTLLWVLDAVEETFRLFGGLDPVYTRDAGGSFRESGSFLLTLFKNNLIQSALLGMIAASFVLCFLVAIIATVKAAGNLEIDPKKQRPVNKVLRLTASALLKLILVPAMALFMIMLGDAVLKSIDLATNPSQSNVSDIVFTIGTLDAVRDDDDHPDADYYNSTTRVAALSGASQSLIDSTSDFGLTDKYRKTYYQGDTMKIGFGLTEGSKKRDVLYKVLETFDIRRIDYMITIGGALLFIYIFGTLAVSMVSRAFDIIMLLLVEPFIAATIPLDEGAKFQKWTETFIGRLGSCYAMVVGVNVYLGVISLIFSNKIAFFGEGTTPGVVYLVNLIFTLVGAYTITKAGPTITQILSDEAADREFEGISAGQTLTRGAMNMVSYPYRKLAGFMFKDLRSRAAGSIIDAYSSIRSGRNPKPGAGDAYGKSQVTPAGTGNTFTGKKSADGVISGGTDNKTKTSPDNKGGEVKEPKSPQAFDGSKKNDGLKLNGLGIRPPETSYLNAGDNFRGNQEIMQQYVYIGQEEEKEREKNKKMDELLGQEIEMQTLLAAESSTDMDLNGDGKVSKAANEEKDLSIKDIVGSDNIESMKDIVGQGNIESMHDIVGSGNIESMHDIVGSGNIESMKDIVENVQSDEFTQDVAQNTQNNEIVEDIIINNQVDVATGEKDLSMKDIVGAGNIETMQDIIENNIQNESMQDIIENNLNDEFIQNDVGINNDVNEQIFNNNLGSGSSNLAGDNRPSMDDVLGENVSGEIHEILGSKSNLTTQEIVKNEDDDPGI